MSEPYSDFDPVLHGLEEGFAYLDNLLEDLHDGRPAEPDLVEATRDNLATALTKYKEQNRSR